MFKKIESFFKNVVSYCKAYYGELAHKTTWSTSRELIHNAVVALFASLAIVPIVFCTDWCFQHLMGIVYPG